MSDTMMINEHFRSIQGEGIMMGIPTYFIRTMGCNLSCDWCDTLYANESGMEMSVGDIIALTENTENVCVTGGEPLLQPDIRELLNGLIAAGKRTVVETNGSVDVSSVPEDKNIIVSMDIKCPSSKMTDRMFMSNIEKLAEKDQLKFVIKDDNDFEFAVEVISSRKISANIIFCPVGGMELRPIIEEVLARGLNVRILPQLHKLVWGDRRSV